MLNDEAGYHYFRLMVHFLIFQKNRFLINLNSTTMYSQNLDLPLLDRAIRSKDKRSVSIILSNYWKSNKYDVSNHVKELDTPMQAAVVLQCEDIIKLLIKYGADVNGCFIFDNKITSSSPRVFIPYLHWLATFDNDGKKLKIASILIKYGAEVNKTDYQNQTPFEIALKNGNVEYIKLLLENKCSVGEKWDLYNEYVPLKCDVLRAPLPMQVPILKILMVHGKINHGYINAANETILHVLLDNKDRAGYNLLEMCKILANDELINAMDLARITPFYKSIFSRNTEVVSYFIKKVVDIDNQIFIDKSTALHEACRIHYKEGIFLLLLNGAQISLEDWNHETPLFLLDPQKDNYDKCLIEMVKGFAKLAYENLPISPKDEDLIKENPKAQYHFDKCLTELTLMDSQFYSCYSHYSILNRSLDEKNLARLKNSKKFCAGFKENLSYPYYKSDFMFILNETSNKI